MKTNSKKLFMLPKEKSRRCRNGGFGGISSDYAIHHPLKTYLFLLHSEHYWRAKSPSLNSPHFEVSLLGYNSQGARAEVKIPDKKKVF